MLSMCQILAIFVIVVSGITIPVYAEVYQNEELQLQLSYTSEFIESYENLNWGEVVAFDSPELNLIIGYQEDFGNVDLKEYGDSTLEMLKSLFPDLEVVSSKSLVVDDIPAWETSYILKDFVPGISLQNYQVFVVKDESLYGFTFTTPEDKFSNKFSKIQEIVESIKFGIEDQNSFEIPDWIRNNAQWWAQGAIGDQDFISGIQYLIKEGIIQIPKTDSSENGATEEIPVWIKNNADWWSQGLISDDDFVKGIQYLVEQGIIQV
jgi:hypothetical protein